MEENLNQAQPVNTNPMPDNNSLNQAPSGQRVHGNGRKYLIYLGIIGIVLLIFAGVGIIYNFSTRNQAKKEMAVAPSPTSPTATPTEEPVVEQVNSSADVSTALNQLDSSSESSLNSDITSFGNQASF